MKNPFKKSAKTESKSTVQKLDKKQLEKVIGGIDTTTPTPVRQVPTAEGPRYQ